MKCDNCDRPAVYLVQRPTANTVHFCAYDLPRDMYDAAANGDYDLPEETSSKKKKTVVEPEVVEPEAEEAPAETSDENL